VGDWKEREDVDLQAEAEKKEAQTIKLAKLGNQGSREEARPSVSN